MRLSVAPGAQPGTRIISMANQKGGVAKTTSTVNLAAALKERGMRVLVVDLDPQSNLTMSFGIDPEHLQQSMFDVLVHRLPIREVIQQREVDVAASSIDLAGAELALSAMIGRERTLEKALAPVRDDYDFILIDTPPSLGLLTLNALVAADTVLIPLHCEYFALEGLADLMATLSRIRNGLNPSLDVEGVVLTMFGDRTNLGAQVAREIREFFESKVYDTVIPRNVRLAEAPSHGLPVLLYDPRSRGAEAYVTLAHELLTRNGAQRRAAAAKA
jgi:chromosome partitioning protein